MDNKILENLEAYEQNINEVKEVYTSLIWYIQVEIYTRDKDRSAKITVHTFEIIDIFQNVRKHYSQVFYCAGELETALVQASILDFIKAKQRRLATSDEIGITVTENGFSTIVIP